MRRAADLLQPHGLAYPLIVKPVAEDASIGIDARAVVHDEAATEERVRFIWAEFNQPAIVEEFIDGRELNIALLADSTGELETLPVSEVIFEALPPGTPRVVSYDAKWVTDSVAYAATPTRCPAALDAVTAERVCQIAKSTARVVGLRDYGRVDMRVRDSDRAPFVLEVNPNPDLSEGAGFMRAASASGRTPTETIRQILERALSRTPQTLPAIPGAS
jgi:D-alanine-D-alanine ligase